MKSLLAARNIEDKFRDRFIPEPNSGCWLWIGSINGRRGYGRVSLGKKRYLAHRFSYEFYIGFIPEGAAIHHKCNVSLCVNPAHLAPVTWPENNALKEGKRRVWFSKRAGIDDRQADVKTRFVRLMRPQPNGCWQWQGGTNGRYGVFDNGYAHRRSYEIFKSSIPKGMTIDHLCGNVLCVNPDHLEAVTQGENNRRYRSKQTHCKRGHLFDEANTWYEKNGARHCRKCHMLNERKRKGDRQAADILGFG